MNESFIKNILNSLDFSLFLSYMVTMGHIEVEVDEETTNIHIFETLCLVCRELDR